MGRVLCHMTVSLDGFIATRDDRVDELFEWYGAGEVALPSANPDISFQLDPASAEMLGGLMAGAGALVAGRRLFDIAGGWSDNHPIGTPVVVVTHRAPDDAAKTFPRTRFVDGVEPAITQAKQIASGKDVILASANIIQQALNLGLVDEVCLSVAPVLLGEGIPYFSRLEHGHVALDDPQVMTGKRALHLRYSVRRP